MRHVHCDGCGRKEPVDTPKSESIMIPVMVTLSIDGRSWAEAAGVEKFEADLCDRCIRQCLHSFFKVPSDVDLEIPAFLSQPLSVVRA